MFLSFTKLLMLIKDFILWYFKSFDIFFSPPNLSQPDLSGALLFFTKQDWETFDKLRINYRRIKLLRLKENFFHDNVNSHHENKPSESWFKLFSVNFFG